MPVFQKSAAFDIHPLPNQFIADRPHLIGYMDNDAQFYVLNPMTVSFDPLTPAHERHESYRVASAQDIGTVRTCAIEEHALLRTMDENTTMLTQDPQKTLSLFRVGMMFETGGLIERVATIAPMGASAQPE